MAPGDWDYRSQHFRAPAPVRPRSGLSEPTLHSLPQRHEHKFVPTAPEYDHSLHGDTPLTPPASDGFMSPPSHGQEFGDPNIPHVWMHNYESVKGGDGGTDAARPVHIHYIEDILQAEASLTSSFRNSSNTFGIPPRKRIRNDWMQLPEEDSHIPELLPKSRKKRHLTDASEATYTCETCGKYFSRIWNYNAHQDTHNPNRPRPHACRHQNCGKAFVRRTDLTRHTQCVHAKDKRFRCELCGGNFARKDTLRRHEEDGCPNRSIIARHKPLNLQSEALDHMLLQRDRRQVGSDYPEQHEQQFRTASQSPPRNMPYLPNIVQVQNAVW
ncbi:hypothetical protein FN846DRAFT_782322 [Sphaerosporella brunnea]|uniref:C2H2 type master regulator of conidiophore development brlA n=1 Tax=Sphaerosporella brunnea TaxID=1250544 RepID=A0A5J5ERA9_9PEZI|nr:hypothetical protein FN846DRAFT_782322 [Sphaerosporella brunnea]